ADLRVGPIPAVAPVVGLADGSGTLAIQLGRRPLDPLDHEVGERAEPGPELAFPRQLEICTRGFHTGIFYAMTFNRMGTVPLPLALHLASYTVLGLFCFFAGSLNLIDPVKIPHGLMFLAVCVFSWGYVFGILMARKEVVDPDLPADFGHDALTDREAQAGALVGAFGGEKRIEDAAADLPRDARPRVVHRQPDPSLARLGPELHDRRLPAPHHVLRVGHEIDHHLL